MRPVVCLLSLVLSGCALFQPGPVIENRFAAQTPTTDPVARVDISVTSAPVPASDSAVALTQLSDRGQAAMTLATQGKPPVSTKADHNDAGDVVVDSVISRRIVVAVRPVTFLDPGDRVDAIRVKLNVDDDLPPGVSGAAPWRIASWTQASDGESVIDIGKLTDVSTASLKATTGVNIGGPLADTSLEGNVGRSLTREAPIKDTTDFDAAVDADGHAWLDETAGWRVSLAHNLSIDTNVAASVLQLEQTGLLAATRLTRDVTGRPGASEPMPGDQVQLRKFTRVAPGGLSPVCGVAKLEYRIRHIVNAEARGTFSESDDRVAFQGGSSTTHFLLAPSPYAPPYAIQTGLLRLTYKNPAGTLIGVQFASVSEATAFRNWPVQVKPKGVVVGAGTVGIGTAHGVRALSATEFSNLLATVANPGKMDAAQRADLVGCPAPAVKPNDARRFFAT